MITLAFTLKLRQYRLSFCGFRHIVNVNELEYWSTIDAILIDDNIAIKQETTKSIILN